MDVLHEQLGLQARKRKEKAYAVRRVREASDRPWRPVAAPI